MRWHVLLFTAAVTLASCAGRAYVIEDDAPPAPREEVVIHKPGYLWVQGHHVRGPRGNWIWRGGYYVRERPSHVYVQGRWERLAHGWIWVDGEWRPRGRVVVRKRS